MVKGFILGRSLQKVSFQGDQTVILILFTNFIHTFSWQITSGAFLLFKFNFLGSQEKPYKGHAASQTNLSDLCLQHDTFITFSFWKALNQRDFGAPFCLWIFNDTCSIGVDINILQRDGKLLVPITVWIVTELPSVIQRPLEICCTV